MRLGGWVCALSASWVIVGCAGSEGPPGCEAFCGADPVPATDFVATVERDVCRALMECTSARYTDLDHCVRDRELTGATTFEAGLDGGWFTYDATAAGACHAAFEDDPCAFTEYFLFAPDFYEVVAVCAEVTGASIVTGQQGAGAPCTDTLQCDASSYCDAGDMCPGQCVARAGVGDACTSWRQCADGLLCDRADTCQPEGLAGDPCEDDGDCAWEFWCIEAEGTCGDRLGAGATCTFGDCGDGLYCDDDDPDATHVCRALVGAGGACASFWACADDLDCVGLGFDTPGTCMAPAARGESCASGQRCEAGSRCVDDTCAALAGLGEPCSTSWGALPCAGELICGAGTCSEARGYGGACMDGTGWCLEGRCVDGTCAPRLEDGEACSAHEQCVSRECSLDVCVREDC